MSQQFASAKTTVATAAATAAAVAAAVAAVQSPTGGSSEPRYAWQSQIKPSEY